VPEPALDEALWDEEEASAPTAEPVQAPTAELTAGRQVVAQALGALLAQRAAVPTVAAPVPQPAAPSVAPLLPLQRTPSSGGLAELQLLADGIDLFSSGRA
jgi:hypothetical protein